MRHWFWGGWLLLASAAAAADLPTAVCEGDEAVRQALQDGALPETPDGTETILHLFFRCPEPVAATARADTLRLLLDAGASVDARDSQGRTPLHAALESIGAPRPTPDLHTDGARLLLARGADPAAADALGLRPLHLAAREPVPLVTQLLLDLEASPGARDGAGHSPLWHALQGTENLQTFELLLKAAERIGDRKKQAEPLQELAILAAAGRRHDVVNLLLQKDPELELAPGDLTATLEVALWQGSPLAAALRLVEAGAEPGRLQEIAGRDLAWRLAMLGREQELAWLLEQGWDINRLSPQGFPPLYFANLDAVRLLLDAGADPALQGEVLGTVLAPVAEPPPAYGEVPPRQSEERAQLLLQAGYPVNLTDSDGHTALQLAIASDNLWLVRALLRRGADPRLHAPGTASLLAQALRRGRLPVVQALLRAQPDFASREPQLLLDYLETGKPDPLLVEALLVAGARFDTNERGEPALLVAARRQHWSLIPLLLRYGADPWATNEQGCTLRCYEWAMPEELREQLPGVRQPPWEPPALEAHPAAFFALAMVPVLALWALSLGWRLARRRSLWIPTLWLFLAITTGIAAGGAVFFQCDPCLVSQTESQLALTASVAVLAWTLAWLMAFSRRLGAAGH